MIVAGSAMLAVLAGAITGLEPHAASMDLRLDAQHIQLVNSSAGAVNCSIRVGDGEWSDPFTLAPAEQVVPDAGSGEAVVELLCNPPVRRARFNLRPGGRYALVENPGPASNGGGEVDLYSVEGG